MFNLNSTPAPTTSQGKPKVKLTVSWNGRLFLFFKLINLHLKGAMDIDDRCSDCSRCQLRYIPFQTLLKYLLVVRV
jgi:hypothetical protein